MNEEELCLEDIHHDLWGREYFKYNNKKLHFDIPRSNEITSAQITRNQFMGIYEGTG